MRRMHVAKGLPYDVHKGLGDFLPPEALRVVGLEYQKGLLDRLNDEVRGTDMEGMSVVQTIVSSSPDRSRVLAFNYASLALNNHFFLENLKPPTAPHQSHQHHIGARLEQEIRSSHSSLAQLKSAISAAGSGLFTSGYVWFVTDAAGNTGVIPTFGPGSLLMRSQSYMAHVKGLKMSDEGGVSNPNTLPGTSPASGIPSQNPITPPHTRSYSTNHDNDDIISRYTASPSTLTNHHSALNLLTSNPTQNSKPKSLTRSQVLSSTNNINETLYPLFCISIYEHNWMSAGFGVWGKEQWLKKFWDVLDWEKVSKAYDYFRVRA
ncbi:hypothetical protein J3R30DRAFT_3298684 [Lentinula aciculospora]|uniref:Manganese/iron superoxide dismutase C-terminal domain-containing protein n=1 Tax=Lentinula aciculospora TaxID=153920 RepID=A0A9W9A2E3_9AGAR|nr:hypothetical protein J3R30DRAFT_3298684 [Lentinula aciculospora]